jgi:hypothetical protein
MATDEEARLDRLRKVIDSGASSTKTGNEQINFRPLAELKEIEADLETRSAKRKRKRVFRMRGGKGF